MDDVVRIVILMGSLLGLGVGAYAGVTVVSIMRRRFDRPAAGRGPDDAEVAARLAHMDQLEARLNELEERVDFAERLITTQHESAQLPAGPRRDG